MRPLTPLLGALLVCCANVASALEPGDPAPAFTATSLDGRSQICLADYRGKVVYLDFWASWCGPCLQSLPLLDELRGEFPEAAFQVLAVNVDRDIGKARAFLARRPVGYPSASDPNGQIPGTFGLETMPTSYLIDPNGVVRYVHAGFRAGDIDGLRRRIADLVAKSAKSRAAKPSPPARDAGGAR